MIVALLAGLAGFLFFAPQLTDRLTHRRARAAPRSNDQAGITRTTRMAACVALAGGAALVIGGAVGLVIGIGLAAIAWRAFAYLERRPTRKPNASLLAQAPVACDLLAAVVGAGTDIVSGLESVTVALDGPIADLLKEFAARLRLGASASVAAAALSDSEIMQPMALAIVRSADSGAPLSDALRRAAADLRLRRRAALLSRARVLGVRAVIPLGVCFLPAFVLLGVVPVVVSLISQVLADLPW